MQLFTDLDKYEKTSEQFEAPPEGDSSNFTDLYKWLDDPKRDQYNLITTALLILVFAYACAISKKWNLGFFAHDAFF